MNDNNGVKVTKIGPRVSRTPWWLKKKIYRASMDIIEVEDEYGIEEADRLRELWLDEFEMIRYMNDNK